LPDRKRRTQRVPAEKPSKLGLNELMASMKIET
jgi:hypothetical protein